MRLLQALLCGALLTAAGCTWIGNTADNLGHYMPVVGERCEHWQCFTESGRKISDANKAGRMRQDMPPPANPDAVSMPQVPQQNSPQADEARKGFQPPAPAASH